MIKAMAEMEKMGKMGKMEKKASKGKVFVIGMDGATFDIIDPMIAEGRLPNLARLMKEGSYGVLESSIPPLSPTAWSSFMTGTNPAKHGILDFFGRQKNSYMADFYNASTRETKAIWSIASEYNRKVGVINVPSTYPPDKVNGFMISGMDTPGSAENYMHPPSLTEELKREIGGYRLEKINLRTIGKNSENQVREIMDLIENRFMAARHLTRNNDWELFVMVFEATDRAQHIFWEDTSTNGSSLTDNKRGDGKIVREVYEKVDEKLGALIEDLDDDARIIVLSDHGFGPVQRAVRLNLWLSQEGYLSFNRQHGGVGQSLSIATSAFFAKAFNYSSRLLKKLLRIKKGGTKAKPDNLNVLPGVDWPNTQAYCIGGMGNIFLNLKGREPDGTIQPGADYNSAVDELIGKLKEFTDPVSGNKVFSNVYKRDEIYNGKMKEKAPDILLDWAYGYSFIGERERIILKIKEGAKGELFIQHTMPGNHLPNGIIIMHGNDIKEKGEIKGANIVDVAPTILYLMGLPVPTNMDGVLLTDAIKDDFINANPVEYQKVDEEQTGEKNKTAGYTDDEADEIKKKLQDLGYIE